MALTTTLAACNVNPALNGPDGATDLPSTLDDQCRYLASFIAQLRDGVSSSGGVLWMTGMIAQFATTTTPVGWLKLNGQVVSRTTYANLFAFATASGLVTEAAYSAGQWGCFSSGDLATTFRVPDFRGMHPRGLDEGRGIDSGRVFGSFQDMQLLQHAHGVTDPTHTHTGSTNIAGGHTHGVTDPGHSHNYGINNVNTAGAGSGAPRLGANTEATSTSGTGISINGNGDHSHTLSINGVGTGISIQNSTGGAEARVKTIAVPFYVKY